jgi:hypothetical protein
MTAPQNPTEGTDVTADPDDLDRGDVALTTDDDAKRDDLDPTEDPTEGEGGAG